MTQQRLALCSRVTSRMDKSCRQSSVSGEAFDLKEKEFELTRTGVSVGGTLALPVTRDEAKAYRKLYRFWGDAAHGVVWAYSMRNASCVCPDQKPGEEVSLEQGT